MYGDAEGLMADLMLRLDDIELNPLEKGLLDRFMADPSANRKMISGLLQKLKKKHEDMGDTYYAKKLNKTWPLFEDHDFWSHEPV